MFVLDRHLDVHKMLQYQSETWKKLSHLKIEGKIQSQF